MLQADHRACLHRIDNPREPLVDHHLEPSRALTLINPMLGSTAGSSRLCQLSHDNQRSLGPQYLDTFAETDISSEQAGSASPAIPMARGRQA
jgi:hypothetical protein